MACLDHDTASCRSCDVEYHKHKVQDRCDANVCKCPNGTPQTKCVEHNATVCSACDDDYQLSGVLCHPIENKRGDIEYTITISNMSLTNVEIENRQQFTTGFVHKVLSRKLATALASTHIGQKRLLSSMASKETVELQAYDNATKVKGVYLTITNIINKDPFQLSTVNDMVLTFTVLVQESGNSLNIRTLVLMLVAVMVALYVVHRCLPSPDNQVVARKAMARTVTVARNRDLKQPLLQGLTFKF